MANIIQLSLQFPVEIWKDIENWKGYYQISTFTRVKSLARTYQQGSVTMHVTEKILSQYIACQTGYKTVTFRRGAAISKKQAVHVLVAKAFVKGYQPGYEVNHIDSNRLNNAIGNLEWTTHKGNIQHAVNFGFLDIKGSKHPQAKLKETQVIEMRKLFNEGCTSTEIAKQFGISRRNTSDVVNKRLWKHI